MKEDRIFPGAESRSGRSQVLKNIAAVPYTITSFHTLFEDVKCLEPCSSLLRDIIPPDLRGSISQSLERIHNGQIKFRYELADGSFCFKVEKTSAVEGIPLTLVVCIPPCPDSEQPNTLGGSEERASTCSGCTPLAIKNGPRPIRR